MGVFLKYLFQLILSPGHGWEDIGDARLHPKILASRGFYPFTALAALSVFVGKFTHPLLTLQELMIGAIVTFVMFFIGYFVAVFLLSVFLGLVVGVDAGERRCQIFSLFIMGLLELIAIVGNLVPITMAITWFLPVYVAVIMWKGARYMGVEKADSGRFMILAIPGVLLPPYLLQFLFTLILK